jgi:CheY-like chemotaxis protein
MSQPLPRILFAEDNPHDVEMTLEALAEHKILNDVVVVNDGAEALDYLFARGAYAGRSDGDPVMVLLDLKMPRIDGLEVLRAIKADERLQAIPVVMLTSSREEQDLIRSYRLGVNAYVVKPVGVPEFVEAIKVLGLFWTIHNACTRVVPGAGIAQPHAPPSKLS